MVRTFCKTLTIGIVVYSLLFCVRATAQQPGAPGSPEYQVLVSWDAIVTNLKTDALKFEELNKSLQELCDSLNKYRPGRVLLPPDVRAEQKRNRLKLIDATIAADAELERYARERRREYEKLRKAEEASQ